MSTPVRSVPSVSVSYARNGSSTRANALGMRPMQERAWERRGEQYLLIKSPPASGKSRALMFIALDKLANHGSRIARHVERHGINKVEAFVDHCLSLENLIDPWSPFSGKAPKEEDPEDDTPYWLVGTRRPQELAAAVAAARDVSG